MRSPPLPVRDAPNGARPSSGSPADPPTPAAPATAPSASASESPLSALAVGAAARVARVQGDDALARRLTDLGFWPGTAVRKVRVAPFGDPSEYHLRGFRLALRRDEAARVLVADAAPPPRAEST